MPEDLVSVGDVVRGAIAGSVARLVEHGEALQRSEEPEDVHQARVATRRLRSDLRTFRPFLEAPWSESLRDDLQWLGTALGHVRDADVLLARLQHDATGLPDTERLAADAVRERLVGQRADARAALLVAWREARNRELLDRLALAAEAPRLLPEAWLPATRALRPVVRRPWRTLSRAFGTLGSEPADHDLHQVRILAKRCRYASDAAAPALGASMRRFSRALARLQDALGEHQDAVVARAWLAKVAGELSATEAFAAGALAGVELAAARDARAAVQPAWRRVRRARPRVVR